MSLETKCSTFTYKRLKHVDINLDVYPPTEISTNGQSEIPLVPAVVYFHGGGLTVGNKRSWFPTWLHKRTTDAGYAFISADYQLLPPATGHDLLEDIQDVLKFVVSRDFKGMDDQDTSPVRERGGFRVDPNAIAVSGSSAGGLCAYLAAIHCVSPRPKVIVSMYGMGADFFSAHYLTTKTKPFFRGREILDPSDFLEFLHPNHRASTTSTATETLSPSSSTNSFTTLEPISDSPLAYHPQTYHIPGYPANPRMLLSRLYLQLGVYIDYYTGEHGNGGVSVVLRDALKLKPGSGVVTETDTEREKEYFLNRMRSIIPEERHSLFPQLNVSSSWPPTMLVHGSQDTAVLIDESRSLKRQLESARVSVELCEVEGREHSFDYEAGAEELFGEKVFDRVGVFLERYLKG